MADLPAYPHITSRHVVHADPAGPVLARDGWSGEDSAAFALIPGARLPGVSFRGSFVWFICSLRPAGSTPCLLPTPPRGDAVGTVFGAEPSNCTDGTFTRMCALRAHGIMGRCVEGAGGMLGWRGRPFDGARGLRLRLLVRPDFSRISVE